MEPRGEQVQVSQPARQVPDVRVSDAERERAVRDLGEHYAQGRLTLAEFADRSDRALQAGTRGELAELTSDLPAPGTVASLPAIPPRPRRGARHTLGLLSFQSRRGRWLVSRQTSALAVLGKVQLDLRNAQLEQAAAAGGDIQVVAVSILGAIELVIPEGVNVDLGGFALMGKHDSNDGERGPLPGLPTVRVRAFSLLGSVVRFTGVERKIRQKDQQRRRT